MSAPASVWVRFLELEDLKLLQLGAVSKLSGLPEHRKDTAWTALQALPVSWEGDTQEQ